MRILFLHDNFPAQFGAFGLHLAEKGWEIWFGTQRKGVSAPGFKVFNYAPHRAVVEGIHPYAANFERAVLNGQAVARTALELKKKGLEPDIVMAHSGWGPGLFVKDVWPDAKYVGYYEWYYRADAPDVAYFGDKRQGMDDQLRARARNAAILSDLTSCDAGLCPTQFQKDQFPACFQDKLTLMHDGIDTEYYAPKPGARLKLPTLDLSHADEIITYVARGMEPYRGFPEFMRMLENLQKQRPGVHAVIVGEDRVAYGKKLPEGDGYKKRMLETCDLDMTRIHFTGLLPRDQYRQVLQASSVHVYFTVPFVLSWSMLEAMSAGRAIVAADVAPVREIEGQSPRCIRLVDHKKTEEAAAAICNVLDDKAERARLSEAARKLILENYAAKGIFERKTAWLEGLLG